MQKERPTHSVVKSPIKMVEDTQTKQSPTHQEDDDVYEQ